MVSCNIKSDVQLVLLCINTAVSLLVILWPCVVARHWCTLSISVIPVVRYFLFCYVLDSPSHFFFQLYQLRSVNKIVPNFEGIQGDGIETGKQIFSRWVQQSLSFENVFRFSRWRPKLCSIRTNSLFNGHQLAISVFIAPWTHHHQQSSSPSCQSCHSTRNAFSSVRTRHRHRMGLTGKFLFTNFLKFSIETRFINFFKVIIKNFNSEFVCMRYPAPANSPAPTG